MYHNVRTCGNANSMTSEIALIIVFVLSRKTFLLPYSAKRPSSIIAVIRLIDHKVGWKWNRGMNRIFREPTHPVYRASIFASITLSRSPTGSGYSYCLHRRASCRPRILNSIHFAILFTARRLFPPDAYRCYSHQHEKTNARPSISWDTNPRYVQLLHIFELVTLKPVNNRLFNIITVREISVITDENIAVNKDNKM